MRIFYILVFSVFLACTTENESDQKLLTGDFEFTNSLNVCQCDSLYLDKLVFYLNDSLFTGVCFRNYKNTTIKREEKHIFNGQMHGLYTAFTPKGDTLLSKLYKKGSLINPEVYNSYTCPCDSLTFITEDSKRRATRYNFYFTGKCYTYFSENDTLKSTVENYRSGYLNGKRIIYDNQGEKIREEIYLNGVKR